MSNLAKRMSVAVASLAVTGGAVLGVGSTASAARATPERARRPGLGVEINDHRWGGDHDYGWDRSDHYRAGCDADCRWDRRNDCLGLRHQIATH
ncbi:hypothetical protein ACFVXA_24555 [Streptomyces sp. NPDC058246]|uniref:hypothetical protein n=1 Tax=unclassified Streptomyces TaxID=2593676 RepID=UPI0036567344